MKYEELNQNYQALAQEMLEALGQASGQALQGEVKVTAGTPAELGADYAPGLEYPLLSVTVSTAGKEQYEHIILVERSLAGHIFSWMVGGDPPEEVAEEHLDAVKETAGQILGQLQAAFDGEDSAFTPGEIAISEIAASDDLTLPGAGLVAEYQFTRGDVEEQYKVTHIIPGEAASEDDPAVETETAEEGAPTAEAEAAEEGAEEPAGEVADAGDDELTSLEADDAFGALEAEMQPDEEEGLQEESAFDDITGEEPAGGDIDDIFGEEIPEVDVGIEETVEASPVQFDEFAQQSPSNGKGRKIDMLLDVELDVTVELGRKVMLVEDILRLGKGSVVELNKLAGEPVDILVNGRKLAEGEVVVVEDHFGVRLTHLIDPKDRIRSLGKG